MSLPSDFDTRPFIPTSNCNFLSSELRINDGIYDVCDMITRPGSGFSDDSSGSESRGFVVSAFQTFPGEDSEKLEQNWITWTGESASQTHFILLSSQANVKVLKAVVRARAAPFDDSHLS